MSSGNEGESLLDWMSPGNEGASLFDWMGPGKKSLERVISLKILRDEADSGAAPSNAGGVPGARSHSVRKARLLFNPKRGEEARQPGR